MAQVNMQQVKELRERTQAGLNDCRTALVEADGDMEKAVEIIQKKGLAKSVKRAGAVATEGVVLAEVAADEQSGVLVEVNIQTDFAARNPDFQSFAADVLRAAARAPDGADLGAEPHPAGGGTLEEARQALVGKLGENVTLRRWARLRATSSGKVQAYVHLGGKIGVLVALEVGQGAARERPELGEFAENLAMQAAAMSPLYLAAADVPEAAQRKQAEIYAAQPEVANKPEKARPKIIEGKLGKWLKEICLLEQDSVIESDKTVDQVRGGVGKALGTELKVTGFLRYERGEGIVKPESPDFAAEVSKMAGG
jgi:elongation factor Ts